MNKMGVSTTISYLTSVVAAFLGLKSINQISHAGSPSTDSDSVDRELLNRQEQEMYHEENKHMDLAPLMSTAGYYNEDMEVEQAFNGGGHRC